MRISHSDDGSRVVVDNELVVDNDGKHAMEWKEGEPIELVRGWYPLTVDYYDWGTDKGIQVKYKGPDTFGKETMLQGFHEEANPCGLDYTLMTGDVPGWGAVCFLSHVLASCV